MAHVLDVAGIILTDEDHIPVDIICQRYCNTTIITAAIKAPTIGKIIHIAIRLQAGIDGTWEIGTEQVRTKTAMAMARIALNSTKGGCLGANLPVCNTASITAIKVALKEHPVEVVREAIANHMISHRECPAQESATL